MDVYVVVAPTPAATEGIAALLASSAAIRITALSGAVLTLDEVRRHAVQQQEACSWVVRRANDELDALLPTAPLRLRELEAALDEANTRCHSMQLEFAQFQQDVQELQAQYAKVSEVHQRVLWEYLPAHDPSMASIPSISYNVEESVRAIGKYTIQATIGEGQYASVFACCLRPDDAHAEPSFTPSPPLAVKVIEKAKLLDVLALQRIQMEIAALSDPLLRHPSVLFLRDVIHTPKYMYLVTDRGGKDLFEYFGAHENGISEATASPLLFKIVDAIRHLHTHGYCHRDLKPENILFAPESASVKIVDFGLCSRVARGRKAFLSDFCGSPGFFAPEILLAESYDGFKADVWSLGCILLELLLGNAFFLSVWMTAYSLDVLGDRALYRDTLHANLAKLREALDAPPMQLYSGPMKELLLLMLDASAKTRLTIQDVYEHPVFEAQRRKKQPLVKSGSSVVESSGPTRLAVQGHVHIHPMSHPPSPPRPRSEEHPVTSKVILPAIAKLSPDKPR
ncbi:CAMK/CAMKL protein kinase [Saprolegnia parasitica CBS 223.65]|uniref:CAMK/CAMKL protein kinase n=1 Tax=Saprolegnia parasitica (strain CBS 223.65) TaxID=695850 RepID=A0A067CEG6_SAPPC|nr:CAMK/CAMKL protein kinase [Saprolegnia parasitica CBS 223.65]KDO28898.1 CAMK/CAMKL protein kinase [Saprolegnia parasitica CBS 223.65]|eukprot:XP_012200442.1 CAMK/CAMKL protein kinase [Saprolegnia parasitica CBS 223.65]